MTRPGLSYFDAEADAEGNGTPVDGETPGMLEFINTAQRYAMEENGFNQKQNCQIINKILEVSCGFKAKRFFVFYLLFSPSFENWYFI